MCGVACLLSISRAFLSQGAGPQRSPQNFGDPAVPILFDQERSNPAL